MKTPEDFEMQLKAALRREAAPAGFTEAVMARTNASKVVVLPWWRSPWLQSRAALLVAAGLLIGAVIPASIIQHQRRERALEAKRQLVTALQITRAKLASTKQKIHKERRHV